MAIKFPYTDLHKINLDWIINSVKDMKKKIEGIVGITASATTIPYYEEAEAKATTSEDGTINIEFKIPGGSPGGPPGPEGPQGPKGEKGDQGNTGPQGPRGFTGAAFTYDDFTPEQLEGLRGPTGPTGPQGPRGEASTVPGPTGPRGNTPVFSIGSVEGLDTGEPAYVSVDTSDPDSPILSFGLPRGLQGPQGVAGAQGLRGEQGLQGPVGPQGEQGPQGPSGGAIIIQYPAIRTQEPITVNWASNLERLFLFRSIGSVVQAGNVLSYTTSGIFDLAASTAVAGSHSMWTQMDGQNVDGNPAKIWINFTLTEYSAMKGTITIIGTYTQELNTATGQYGPLTQATLQTRLYLCKVS